MNMIWILSAVAILSFIYFLLHRRLSQPLLKEGTSRERFTYFIADLLARGAHGTRLVIRPDESDLEVKIAKTIEPNGERKLQILFADAPWSQEYYPEVKRALTKHAIPFTERQWHEPPIRKLLFALEIRGPEDAARIAVIAFDAMGVSAGQTFTLHYEGPPSWTELKRRIEETRSRSRAG